METTMDMAIDFVQPNEAELRGQIFFDIPTDDIEARLPIYNEFLRQEFSMQPLSLSDLQSLEVTIHPQRDGEAWPTSTLILAVDGRDL